MKRAIATPLLGSAVLFLVWLGLRVWLWSAGAPLGESVTVRVDSQHVAKGLLFRSAEGTKPRPLLIAAHGGLATKETLLGLCYEAVSRGADCVTIDELGHGASSPVPILNTISAMRAALHVERALGQSAEHTYFVGHSMGAYLGCGSAFSCSHCVAIGQSVPCEDRRMIYGRLHQQLGLSAAFYLPVSHVLEPWTPSVIETAIDRALPLAKPKGATLRISMRIALAWGSLVVMMCIGVILARCVRQIMSIPGPPRGLLAAAIVWCALAVGSYRTLWWLLPFQRTDLLIVLSLILSALMVTMVARWLSLRHPLWGVFIAALLAEIAAVCCYAAFPAEPLRGLLRLPLGLLLPLIIAVTAMEKLSRHTDDSRESALFAASLLGTFLALLVPGL